MNIADLVNDDATLISRRAWSDPEVYELEKRGIFGEASPDDARELVEEGIEVYPLPKLPEDHN